MTLKHGAESIFSDRFSRTGTLARAITSMPEREANEERFVHGLLAISHVLQCGLLVMDLFILGHIGLVGEIVEVAGIGLGVELWDKWCTLRAEGSPVCI